MKIYQFKEYLLNELKTKNYIQISKENNVDTSTIQRYMRRHGLTKKRVSWTKEEIKILDENYGINQDLHKLFPNRTAQSVYHKGNKLGFKRNMRRRNHYVNPDFFKKWSPESAYVFGLFCSDGHVSVAKDYCSIHLHSNDTYILEKINRIIKSNYPISRYKDSSMLRIYNKIFCKDLVILGCTPRKSLNLKFPEIPENYLSHFIRGFFDGDGSIYFNKPNTIKINFISTKQFLESLQMKLKSILGLKVGPLQKNVKMYLAFYYSDDARKLCNWMYENSKDLYLTRKKERFDRHISLRANGKL